MEERYEFRLLSKYLSLIADPAYVPRKKSIIATSVGGVVGDPQFIRIGELDQRLRNSGQGVAFGSWEIKRSYSKEELARAQLFLLTAAFTHLSAEEYGTRYQECAAHEHDAETIEHVEEVEFRVVRRRLPCRLCSKQLGPLRFPFRN